MLGRIVEIAEPDRHLSLFRGFLRVSSKEETLGEIPLDEILGVVVSGHGATHSSNLIVRLSEMGISFCICGNNFMPTSMMIPVAGNVAQSRRFRIQSEMSIPRQKQIWATVVKEKIKNQAEALRQVGQETVAKRLDQIARRVRSGDPENLEAQAARFYWPAMMGEEFRRRQEEPGPNGLLNYGYTIIRSCMARATVGAGLHPTLGIRHKGPTNPMCLVDDFMEPFRPICDLAVNSLLIKDIEEVSRDAKHALANMTLLELPLAGGSSTLFNAMSDFVLSFIEAAETGPRSLMVPGLPSRLSFGGLINRDA